LFPGHGDPIVLNLRQRCADCDKPLYMGETWHEVPDAKFACQACYDVLTGAVLPSAATLPAREGESRRLI
jgi:hypothetical protein